MCQTDQTRFSAVREYLAPVLRESRFQEHGQITPAEFVLAGDLLSYKYPRWRWASGEPAKRREYLPDDKQFLICKGVPCFRRISQLREKKRRSRMLSQPGSSTSLSRTEREARRYGGAADDTEQVVHFHESDGEQDDWILTHVGAPEAHGHHSPTLLRRPMSEDQLAQDLSARLSLAHRGEGRRHGRNRIRRTQPLFDIGSPPAQDQLAEIPSSDDLQGFGQGVQEENDLAEYVPESLPSSPTQSRIETTTTTSLRTYDCIITYDKYYQTPRMWLIGYDANGIPLQPNQIFEDVASDYAYKTVTIEPFPHGIPGASATHTLLATQMASKKSTRSLPVHIATIHPCKHASMMRKMIHQIKEPDEAAWPAHAYVPLPPPGDRSLQHAEPNEVHVDEYLVLFLKFMASIVPTIALDAV